MIESIIYALVYLVIYLVVIGVVFWALTQLIAIIPGPPQIKTIASVLLYLALALVILLVALRLFDALPPPNFGRIHG